MLPALPLITLILGYAWGVGTLVLAMALLVRRLRREFADEAADVAETLARAQGELADARAERDFFRIGYEEAIARFQQLLDSPADYEAVRDALREDGLL